MKGAALAGAAAAVTALAAATAATQGTGPPPFRFADAAAEAGLEFVHATGAGGRRYMVETMGSGLGLADLDGDGWLDAAFAQGAATPGFTPPQPLRDEGWRGGPGGRFQRMPAWAAPGGDSWSMGIAVADYDDDGFPDVYVTALGASRLYRNHGDGTFHEVVAGVEGPSWGSSAAWADVDRDGDLDLYVANYVDFAWDNHKFCGDPRRNLRAYCHPDVYAAQADRLYRNDGDGTFSEIGNAAGIADTLDGKGLGVAFGDWDDDGDPDVYVANDSTRNFLYTNAGGARFREDGLLLGAGFNENGQAEAGMGTDWGDADGDGDLDVVVTNLDLETNTYYRNLGGAFTDATRAAGLAEPSLLAVGFGANWIDADNDGDLDLFIANGHIIDNITEFRDNLSYAQPNHLYRNGGDGTFEEIGGVLGPGMALVRVSRGSAVGDVDNDGDLDLVVSNNGQRADYLRNDGGAQAGRWLQLRLVGRPANRSAAGARVTALVGGTRPLVREVTAGSSFASSSDPRVHLGLGAAVAASVRVRWPDGTEETAPELAANRLYVWVQGRGVVASRPAGGAARPGG